MTGSFPQSINSFLESIDTLRKLSILSKKVLVLFKKVSILCDKVLIQCIDTLRETARHTAGPPDLSSAAGRGRRVSGAVYWVTLTLIKNPKIHLLHQSSKFEIDPNNSS